METPEPPSKGFFSSLFSSAASPLDREQLCKCSFSQSYPFLNPVAKFIQEIIRASLVYVPEVSLSGLDSKPFHKQQFFSNTFKYYKATQVFSAVHKIYHFVMIG